MMKGGSMALVIRYSWGFNRNQKKTKKKKNDKSKKIEKMFKNQFIQKNCTNGGRNILVTQLISVPVKPKGLWNSYEKIVLLSIRIVQPRNNFKGSKKLIL